MSKNSTSFIFTGDIGFDRYMDKKWADENLLSKDLIDFFHSAEHVVLEVEGAVIDAVDDGSRGVFFHSMNPAAVDVFKKMGADVWSIGNNHSMDAGLEGADIIVDFTAPAASVALAQEAAVQRVEAQGDRVPGELVVLLVEGSTAADAERLGQVAGVARVERTLAP